MLDIARIDHISMAVPDLQAQVELLVQLFGFRPSWSWEQDREQEGYRGVALDIPGDTDVGWEVLAPDGEDSHIQRFLDSPNGPGLHHVALQVPDIDVAVEELRQLGIEPSGQSPADVAGGWREAYIHPRRGGNGFLFQFFSPGEAHRRRVVHSAPDGDHALGIKAVNHLSHAHPDGEELGRWYERTLGMRIVHRSPDGEHADFTTHVLETPGGQMRWEILQPAGPDSFVQRFIDTRGPAMHHVAFEVEDWDRAVAACEHHAVPTFGEREGETDGARWREAFIHPRHTGGFLAQFFWQERPGIWI